MCPITREICLFYFYILSISSKRKWASLYCDGQFPMLTASHNKSYCFLQIWQGLMIFSGLVIKESFYLCATHQSILHRPNQARRVCYTSTSLYVLLTEWAVPKAHCIGFLCLLAGNSCGWKHYVFEFEQHFRRYLSADSAVDIHNSHRLSANDYGDPIAPTLCPLGFHILVKN